MSSNPVPDYDPVGDSFTGFVLQVGEHQALALAPESGVTVVTEGQFVIRYGLHYLGKPHLSIVPGLVVLDYGDFLTGEEAWNFLVKGSNLYPRSEVIGYRNDGQEEMIVIKALDISIPPEVLVYQDARATSPIARPSAVIAPVNTELPARLLEYLPRFDGLTDWQQAL